MIALMVITRAISAEVRVYQPIGSLPEWEVTTIASGSCPRIVAVDSGDLPGSLNVRRDHNG
jgi:hypothetical protein